MSYLSVSGVTDVHLIGGNMAICSTKKILLHHVVPSVSRVFPDPPHCIFQQENNPNHTANVAQNWIHNTNNIQVLPWPSQNSDLNLLKNVWEFLDKKLKTRQCRNKYDILPWNALSPNILTNPVAYIYLRIYFKLILLLQ